MFQEGGLKIKLSKTETMICNGNKSSDVMYSETIIKSRMWNQ